MSTQPEQTQTPVLNDIPIIEKEIRFAVVMYGGISLAIYIYGVAKELYHLVRATATRYNPDMDREEYVIPSVEGTEAVYRQLGQKLHARFVVDILSGSSAGGINAVYLAKALVNDQDFGALKDLWIEEGDINLLINDKQSRAGLGGLKEQKVPLSLLNSQRMYYKLLEALDKMEASATDKPCELSPFVQDLDLSITATDIRGLVTPIKLSGGETNEFNYRTVFRFHYAAQSTPGGNGTPAQLAVIHNDFRRKDNPFLAFAARCTSSIPPAFEPMQLDDIRSTLKAPAFQGRYIYEPELWKDFYKEYTDAKADFPSRSFGDGGYLDNKPFGYATEDMLRRRADLPVERRLIYIEPAPEHPQESAYDSTERPDAIENLLAAGITLPRYESIRGELEQVNIRNRFIRRVKHVLAHVDHAAALASSGGAKVKPWQLEGDVWAGKYLNETIKWYGAGYAAYHQLRVEDVLDSVKSALACALGWDKDEDVESLHTLVEEWRRRKYTIEKPRLRAKKLLSENDLLFRLDIAWRLRRLRFLQSLLNSFLVLLPRMGAEEESLSEASVLNKEKWDYMIPKGLKKRMAWPKNGAQADDYRKLFNWAKLELNEAFIVLRDTEQKFLGCGSERQTDMEDCYPAVSTADSSGQKTLDDFKEAIQQLNLQPDKLRSILADEAETDLLCGQIEKLSLMLAAREPRAQGETKGYLRSAMSEASRLTKPALGILDSMGGLQENQKIFKPIYPLPSVTEGVIEVVWDCLQYYFDRYEYFDMLTYPIFYGTEVGESDVVEVIRISPEDAPSIINELAEGKRKLAGLALASFGAFFVREWRENDMLWGRLDGAERLIKMLWPVNENDAEQIELTRNAHNVILAEDLRPRDQRTIFQWVGDLARGDENQGQEAEGIDQSPAPKKDSPIRRDLLLRQARLLDLKVELRRAFSDSISLLPQERKTLLKERDDALATLDASLDEVKKALDKELASGRYLVAEQNRSQAWLSKLSALPADLKVALAKRIQELDKFRYQAVLRVFARDQDLLDLFKSGYDINREFPRRQTVNLMARTLQVTGNLFQGLTTKYPILSGPVGLLIFAGRLFFGLAQMATENIFSWLFLNLILALYVMFGLIVAGGTLLHYDSLTNLGWIGLELVLFVNVSILFMASWMQKRIAILRTFKWLANLIAWTLALGALALLILGLAYARSLGSATEIGKALYAFFSSFLLK